MTNLTKDLGFTIAFLIGALLISMTMGDKPLYWYLILVLLSMVVMNAATIGLYARKVMQ
jgi:hypothetical protein